MATEWGDAEELDDEELEGDPGFLGGGSLPETIGGDDDDAELDEHGDNLANADEDMP